MTNTIFDWLFAFEKSVFLRKHFQIRKMQGKITLMWLSAVEYSALLPQRCSVQCSALLSAVAYSALLYSALSPSFSVFSLHCPRQYSALFLPCRHSALFSFTLPSPVQENVTFGLQERKFWHILAKRFIHGTVSRVKTMNSDEVFK